MDAGNTLHPARRVAPALDRARDAGSVIGADRYAGDQVLFYLGAPAQIIRKPSKMGAFLRAGERNLLVLRSTHYEETAPFLPPGTQPLAHWGTPEAGYIVVGVSSAPAEVIESLATRGDRE